MAGTTAGRDAGGRAANMEHRRERARSAAPRPRGRAGSARPLAPTAPFMPASVTLPALVLGVFAAGVAVGRSGAPPAPQPPTPPPAPRVFELRTYTTLPGRLPALHRRFREHTLGLFARHGMTNVVYGTPQDSARSRNTLVYLVAHPSRAAAARSWAAFVADPEWRRVQAASEADGRIVERVESVYLEPTDYSPMR